MTKADNKAERLREVTGATMRAISGQPEINLTFSPEPPGAYDP